jgi:Family of unknown function (DUF6101)
MSAGGAKPAGSSRELRLDPLALPVRFCAADASADDEVRLVEVHNEGVVVRRSVRGVPIAVSLPVSAFLGVAIRLFPPDVSGGARVAVILQHRDPALSIPLYTATNSDDVLAEWQLWARTFAVPMLVADEDGTLREPFARLGGVRVERPSARKRRRGAIARRRPRIFMRRKPGRIGADAPVHREHEIIARD